MGRASRRKFERRQKLNEPFGPRTVRSLKIAARDEEFGRTVGDQLNDYLIAARRNENSLKSAIVSRHNQRMQRVGFVHPTLRRRSRLIVNQLFGLDLGLRGLGADTSRWPVDPGGGWVEHLDWGVDSLVASVRLLAAGQTVGAAQIARSQFERWSINLANSTGVKRERGEKTAEYYSRLWTTVDQDGLVAVPESERSDPGRTSIDGHRLDPAGLYVEISDFLHGRGDAAAAAYLEASDLLCHPKDVEGALRAGNRVLDVIELCIERLRVCIAGTFMQIGAHPHRAVSLLAVSKQSDPAGSSPFPGWSLWPLNLVTGLSPGVVAALRSQDEIMNRMHRGERPAGRLYRDDEISNIFFISRRARSAEHALAAFAAEERLLGEPLDGANLSGRESRVIITAELLGLIARWSGEVQPMQQDAAAVASSSLRSAFWLWLEDDDRGMGVLRITLESLARLRTWIRNQNRAKKLEGSTRTTPRDWLDSAGWRRLEALNLALGEMAHTHSNPRWGGARAILTQLITSDVEPEYAPYRARGFALESVIRLSAQVALEALAQISSEFEAAVRQHMSNVGLLDVETEKALEEWLDRCWQRRDLRLGESDFREPTAEQRIEEFDRIRRSYTERFGGEGRSVGT